jgi:hypothetical protein
VPQANFVDCNFGPLCAFDNLQIHSTLIQSWNNHWTCDLDTNRQTYKPLISRHFEQRSRQLKRFPTMGDAGNGDFSRVLAMRAPVIGELSWSIAISGTDALQIMPAMSTERRVSGDWKIVLAVADGQMMLVLCDSQYCVVKSSWRPYAVDCASVMLDARSEILAYMSTSAAEKMSKQFGFKPSAGRD